VICQNKKHSQLSARICVTKQIIADQGSDIKKHPALSCQTSRGHAIPNLAHKIACMVKLLLSSDNVFQSFKAQFSQTRAAFQQSELNFLNRRPSAAKPVTTISRRASYGRNCVALPTAW
jgi:hypothetical protein